MVQKPSHIRKLYFEWLQSQHVESQNTHAPPYRQPSPPPPPHGSINLTHLEEISCMVKLPHLSDKKEKKIFLIYKEIQMGAVAQSYMRKGFLIYDEMRKYLVIY
jgi:hypothetical protein